MIGWEKPDGKRNLFTLWHQFCSGTSTDEYPNIVYKNDGTEESDLSPFGLFVIFDVILIILVVENDKYFSKY